LSRILRPSPRLIDWTIDYSEGADVGYRWFAKQARAPLYPFGYGLSYTHFSYSNLHLNGKSDLTATFTIRNEGNLAGADRRHLTKPPFRPLTFGSRTLSTSPPTRRPIAQSTMSPIPQFGDVQRYTSPPALTGPCQLSADRQITCQTTEF
jgi:hypothetical protein